MSPVSSVSFSGCICGRHRTGLVQIHWLFPPVKAGRGSTPPFSLPTQLQDRPILYPSQYARTTYLHIMFYVGVGRLKGGAEPRPAFTGGNNQWIWTRPVRGRPQMQLLKEKEGMGDAPPSHWTKIPKN